MNSNRNGKVIMPKDVALFSNRKRKSKKQCQTTVFKNEDPADATSISTLKKSFAFINLFGSLLGMRVAYKYKINFRLLCTITILTLTWIQLFYSQLKYFAYGEHRRILEVFAVYGIAISCSLKLGCFLKFNKRIAALHSFTYKITRLAGKDAAEQLNKQHCYNYKIMKVIALVLVTSGLIFLYYPSTSFIFKNELVSLLPIEITFVDQSKLSGFLVANFIMTMMGVYALLGTIFSGLHIYAVISNYSIQVDVLEYDIRQLDALWSQAKKSSLAYRHSFLRNICQKCQDKDKYDVHVHSPDSGLQIFTQHNFHFVTFLCSYIVEMKKIFDQNIYFYFVAVYMSQIICLYEIEMNNWMPGYGIAYGLFTEMLLYCLLGTKTTVINERLYYILTQSNWYTYDIYSQKLFLILLNSCMNSQELWIGPLAPLSVVTGIQIIKSVYSYYTFLTEAV